MRSSPDSPLTFDPEQDRKELGDYKRGGKEMTSAQANRKARVERDARGGGPRGLWRVGSR